MFGADVIMFQPSSLLNRVLDRFFGARRLRQPSHRNQVGPAADEFLDFQAHGAQVDSQLLENVGGDAGSFFDETEEDVFRSDVFVVETERFLMRELHDFARSVGKSLVRHILFFFPIYYYTDDSSFRGGFVFALPGGTRREAGRETAASGYNVEREPQAAEGVGDSTANVSLLL